MNITLVTHKIKPKTKYPLTREVDMFSLKNNRELTQQVGCNTQDGRMTKRYRVRLGMHSLAPHFLSFCRPSAVLSLPAVLLRKLPNITVIRQNFCLNSRNVRDTFLRDGISAWGETTQMGTDQLRIMWGGSTDNLWEVCGEVRPFPASIVTLALGYPLSQGYQQANTKCCVEMHGCSRGF